MKEYEVQIWYGEEEDGSLGVFDEFYEHDTLAEALVEYNRRRTGRVSAMHPYKCHHIMLMHYPDYDKSEDGGDGKVVAEEGGE
jgi:hypothetical protein